MTNLGRGTVLSTQDIWVIRPRPRTCRLGLERPAIVALWVIDSLVVIDCRHSDLLVGSLNYD